MTIAELVEFLKTQPQELPVAFRMYSEQVLLRVEDITVEECCLPREDGWVPDNRPDKKTQKYLMFPGN